MPRKPKTLCRQRGCRNKVYKGQTYCTEHMKKRPPESEAPMTFAGIKEVNARAGKLVSWIDECILYVQDIVNDQQSILRQFQHEMQPDHAREYWLVTFEAEKWIKNLKFESLLELEKIRVLLYGGDA